MSHTHPLNTFTPDFRINATSRELIQINTDAIITLMQYDHNSEKLRFECPRYIDGHDMSLCNKVEVHFVNSDVAGGESKGGYYTVADLAVNSSDPSLVNFSWVVSRNATENVGTLVFSVRFICLTGDVIDYVWHTMPFTYVSVDQGLISELDPSYQEIYLDNLETEAGKIVVEAAEAKTTALEAAERASEAINDLYNMDVTDKAPAIVCEASGEVISITDSANMPLKGLRLFGKSAQDGIPTPTNPVEIVSVENPTLTVCGKNLCSSQSYGVIFPCRLEANVSYIVSVDNSVSDAMCLLVYDKNQTRFHSVKCTSDTGNRRYALLTPTQDVYYAMWAWSNSTTVENGQIELGETVGEYKQYIGQDLEFTHTFNGIPVTSGSNYIDASGQKWICDEVDLKRGIRIKRLGYETHNINFDTTDSSGRFVCKGVFDNYYELGSVESLANIGKWSTVASAEKSFCIGGQNFYYRDSSKTLDEVNALFSNISISIVGVLSNPVEIPLTETEIAAYKALHTNKPNTIVLNDSGAWQSVEYVADTKLYIDNKFAELAKR